MSLSQYGERIPEWRSNEASFESQAQDSPSTIQIVGGLLEMQYFQNSFGTLLPRKSRYW